MVGKHSLPTLLRTAGRQVISLDYSLGTGVGTRYHQVHGKNQVLCLVLLIVIMALVITGGLSKPF